MKVVKIGTGKGTRQYEEFYIAGWRVRSSTAAQILRAAAYVLAAGGWAVSLLFAWLWQNG